MASEHQGEAQFEAEAEVLIDEEAQRAERLQKELAEINARRVLQGKDAYTVIGEDGSVVRDGSKLDDATGTETINPPWPHNTLEYMDEVWEYRVPKPLAAMFLGAAARKTAKAGRKMDAIMGYLEHVLSEKSFDRMMERAQDHDDEFDTEHMAHLMREISSAGSARPTGSISR